MMNRIGRFRAMVGTFALVAACTPAMAGQPADLVLTGGKIFTADPDHPWAQAVAIAQGKIVAVGTDKEVAAAAGRAAVVRNLRGRTVIPGLNDVHVHTFWASQNIVHYRCNFPVFSTFEQVLDRVRACSKSAGRDDWIVGEYWSSNLLPKIGTLAALKALDEASGGRPVYLRDDTTHNRWVSTRAMELAGIDRRTQEPAGGKIVRDPATGEAVGLFVERAAFSLVEKATPIARPFSEADMPGMLQASIAQMSRRGITGFQDARIDDVNVGAAFARLDRAGKLNARVALSTYFDASNKADPAGVMATAAKATGPHVATQYAKIYLDGVMTTRTAVFVEPYHLGEEHDPNFRGEYKMKPGELVPLVVRLDALGVSIKLHAAGDGAVREALDAIEAARALNGDRGPVHQIAHGGYIKDDDLARLVPLRVAIDASPTVWFPGPIADGTAAQIGTERTNHYWPFKTMVQSNVMLAGGSDWKTLPDEYSDIWAGIEGMVTRRNPTGRFPGAMWPEQSLTIEQAVSAYTAGSARAMGMTAAIGSLMPGKWANLAILDRDIFTIKPDDIGETRVLETIFEGRVVYAADPASAREGAR